MVGVIGSGQVAKHVIEELRRRGTRFVVFTRSVPADAEPGVFVSYTPQDIAAQILLRPRLVDSMSHRMTR